MDPFLPFFLVLTLLTLPLNWLLASTFAASFHELCHILMVIVLHGELYDIRIRIGGAVIHSRLPGRFQELICILAGPVGSLALFFFWRSWPELAVCGLTQGIFNLLPLPNLDGGRILRSLLEAIFPGNEEVVHKICLWYVPMLTCALLMGLLLYLFS